MNPVPRAVPLMIAGLFFALVWVALVLAGPSVKQWIEDMVAQRPTIAEQHPVETARAAPVALPSVGPPPCVAGTGRTQPAKAIAPERWLMTDDYPAKSLFFNEQGTVRVLMSVDKTGRIADCTVARSSGFERLDRAACTAVTLRGRFEPARDPAGCPIPSESSRSIRWVIPQ